MLAVVVPRLALVGFNYAQPFLINRAIRLLEEKWNDETRNYGYGLIAATGIIYLGIAVSDYILSVSSSTRLTDQDVDGTISIQAS